MTFLVAVVADAAPDALPSTPLPPGVTEPWVHALWYGVIIVTVLLTATAYSIWVERKVVGRMQSRAGPTMVGPAGLLQPVADALKLLQKEVIIPEDSDRWLFTIAPPLTVLFTLATAAVVPFSPDVIAADLDIGVLYVLAFSGLMIFPVWIAGWSSNNKYALLGGMRAVAQGISYAIPLALSALVPVILAGSMSVSEIVRYQIEHGWFFYDLPFTGLVASGMFFLASLAEANRIPFDIPEAESELVAGVTTEYTGMRFGLFYLAEYLHTIIISAVAAALFFGGWDGPWNVPVLWMVLKTTVLFMLIMWVRWSLVRFRADQLMTLCWKWLVPIGLGLVLVSALYVYGVKP